MKKILLFLGGLAVVAFGLLAVFVATYRPAQRPAPREAIERLPARLDRGKYLVEHVVDCFGCHSPRDWSRYGGPLAGPPGSGSGDCLTAAHDAPGRICFPNITPDPTGTGSWSDGEVLRALREGVDKEGKALFPMMPYLEYRNLSDEDARAVVAYLRTVQAVRNAPPASRIDFPVSFFVKMAPQPLNAAVPAVDPKDHLAYGRYLTIVAGCRYCHTPVDEHEQPIPGKDYSGGHVLKGPWGVVRSANLTPDLTGLKGRTREELISRFRAFAGPGAAVTLPASARRNTPMPWLAYAGMSDADLGATYDFLRTVPPIENSVEKYPQQVAAAGGSR